GFTVPESATADDVLMALRSQGWSPFALRRTSSNRRGSPLIGLAARGLIFSQSNNSPVSAKIFVAILLIAAVPACAQAQTRNSPKVTKGDAQKVLKIIRSDKAKIQTYCEINKISDQMNQAYGKNDKGHMRRKKRCPLYPRKRARKRIAANRHVRFPLQSGHV